MTTLATSTVRVATSLTSMTVALETRSWRLELLLRIHIYQHGCGDCGLELLLLRIQDLIWSGGQGGREAGEGY